MYIRTDDDHNIIEVIIVGGKPEKNGYEVDTIDESILPDILYYKYIDGQFIKRETDVRLDKINEIREIKINMMSSICQSVIENGIDVNGKHYSLTAYDQINIMKLESQARMKPDQLLPYHANGELCKLYSAEAIIALAEYATAWKLYWSTYFNHLKMEITNMTDVDKIISVAFGQKLTDESNSSISQILGDVVFTIEPISDEFDYDSLFIKTDAKSLLETDRRFKEAALIAEQLAREEAERLEREKAEIESSQNNTVTNDDTSEEVIPDDEENVEVSE